MSTKSALMPDVSIAGAVATAMAVSVLVSAFPQDGKVVLEVADSGIGIPKDATFQIFERFFRVDKARSRQLGGTGLGLAIVKSICTASNGSVSVKSTEGTGAIFRVEFPLEKNREMDHSQ